MRYRDFPRRLTLQQLASPEAGGQLLRNEFYGVADAGAVQIAPANATHAHSAEAVTVTTTPVVSPDNAAHGHAADAASVAFIPLVAVVDSAHGVASDSPGIEFHAGAGSVAPDSAILALASDTVSVAGDAASGGAGDYGGKRRASVGFAKPWSAEKRRALLGEPEPQKEPEAAPAPVVATIEVEPEPAAIVRALVRLPRLPVDINLPDVPLPELAAALEQVSRAELEALAADVEARAKAHHRRLMEEDELWLLAA